KSHKSLGSFNNFCRRVAITMVGVRLSNMEERKKVIKESTQSNISILVIYILCVMTKKPWCTSISSTMVIAPIRKNSTSEISPKCATSDSETKEKAASSVKFGKTVALPYMRKIQHNTPTSRADAVLFILI